MKILFFIVLISIASSSLLNQQPIIDLVNAKQNQWKAGHNSYFDGRTFEQIKSLMGAIPSPPHLRLPEKHTDQLEDIPTEFFSADKWPDCQSIRQIRDQSACGSCWAFGAVEVMSDRICISSGQKLQVRISAQDLLQCCGLCGYGCGGGYITSAFNYWYRAGISTGWLYNTTNYCKPYFLPPCDHHTTGKYPACGKIQPTPQCQQKCMSGYDVDYKKDRWKSSNVYALSSKPSKIQTEIMTNGPVEAMFTVHTDFLTYKSGVYEHTHGSVVGKHAIKIVGWGVENKKPYWLIANSWNEDWGDKGFFKMLRGENECGIEEEVVAGDPSLKREIEVD